MQGIQTVLGDLYQIEGEIFLSSKRGLNFKKKLRVRRDFSVDSTARGVAGEGEGTVGRLSLIFRWSQFLEGVRLMGSMAERSIKERKRSCY